MKLGVILSALAAAILMAVAAPAAAQTAGEAPDPATGKPPVTAVDKPKVGFNQDYIESLYTSVDIEDPMAVFALVFSSLRDTDTVYPTENYYYFSFITGGKTWWGNLRFDALDRDNGILHLGYFKYDEYGRYEEKNNYYKQLTAKDGVTVARKSAFVYTVSYKGRTVTFRLNDVGWKPPAKSRLRQSEVYVGPVFDESGSRFHLIFDQEAKHLFYILNEDGPVPEHFVQVSRVVLVGERTGFAYFDDHIYNRKILIGVHGQNAQRNNYFDGPFDQLPDNYIDKAKLGEFITKAYPFTKGKIDKYGNYLDREASRFSISSYMIYYQTNQLHFVFDCMRRFSAESDFYKCITPDEEQSPASTAPAEPDTPETDNPDSTEPESDLQDKTAPETRPEAKPDAE